jgi:1-acyl-sn-glycerol-3-phosphate acyltransferase
MPPCCFILAALKALLPIAPIRRALSRALIVIAEQWIAVNGVLFALFTPTQWQIERPDGLHPDGWYLVLSNHQSWVDIPVLQKTFNRRIPFLRFFLKKQLIWVPVLGLAWWALDFPFMQRHSKQTLELHPELRSQDKEATRKACERFRQSPVSVMNFVEGTRAHAQARAAAVAVRASAAPARRRRRVRARNDGNAAGDRRRDDRLSGRPSDDDRLLAGACGRSAHVRQLPIRRSSWAATTRTTRNSARVSGWISGLWTGKDALITRMQAG